MGVTDMFAIYKQKEPLFHFSNHLFTDRELYFASLDLATLFPGKENQGYGIWLDRLWLETFPDIESREKRMEEIKKKLGSIEKALRDLEERNMGVPTAELKESEEKTFWFGGWRFTQHELRDSHVGDRTGRDDGEKVPRLWIVQLDLSNVNGYGGGVVETFRTEAEFEKRCKEVIQVLKDAGSDSNPCWLEENEESWREWDKVIVSTKYLPEQKQQTILCTFPKYDFEEVFDYSTPEGEVQYASRIAELIRWMNENKNPNEVRFEGMTDGSSNDHPIIPGGEMEMGCTGSDCSGDCKFCMENGPPSLEEFSEDELSDEPVSSFTRAELNAQKMLAQMHPFLVTTPRKDFQPVVVSHLSSAQALANWFGEGSTIWKSGHELMKVGRKGFYNPQGQWLAPRLSQKDPWMHVNVPFISASDWLDARRIVEKLARLCCYRYELYESTMKHQKMSPLPQVRVLGAAMHDMWFENLPAKYDDEEEGMFLLAEHWMPDSFTYWSVAKPARYVEADQISENTVSIRRTFSCSPDCGCPMGRICSDSWGLREKHWNAKYTAVLFEMTQFKLTPVLAEETVSCHDESLSFDGPAPKVRRISLSPVNRD